MNFTQRQVDMITYLANEKKLEIKIWNYKGVRSVELHENFIYSLDDPFHLVLADNVKTLKECKQIAAEFQNWLDQFGSYEYGHNIKPEYVTL